MFACGARQQAFLGVPRCDADAARRQAGEAVLNHLYDSELAGAGERDILLRVQWAAQEAERMRQRGSTPPECAIIMGR